jgi:hypothetical protein
LSKSDAASDILFAARDQQDDTMVAIGWKTRRENLCILVTAVELDGVGWC